MNAGLLVATLLVGVSLALARRTGDGDVYDRVAYVDATCSKADDIKTGTDDIDQLKRRCSSLPGCRGFNTQGLLKMDVSVGCRSIDNSTQLFVRRPADSAATQAPITPQPKTFTMGQQQAVLSSQFVFAVKTESEDVRTFLSNAAARDFGMWMAHARKPANTTGTLTGVNLFVTSTSLDLDLGTDESYQLSIPASGAAEIHAPTVYGALHGLTTLGQLVMFEPESQQYVVNSVPWAITDAPRFPHRGILLDTSRHYHSIPIIKRFIDSLSYAKLNVFHWHIVDSQSFPLQLHSLPNLVKGAYTPEEVYTPEDVKAIVDYAQARGVRVIPEFDTPGHAGSWCVGYPDICPSPSCTQPLNPATNATFDLISTLITETKTLFTDSYFHLGGDEVNTACWTKTPSIQAWMTAKHFSADDAYKYFVKVTHDLARTLGRKSIHWEEVFNHFGGELEKDTIFQVWLSHATAAKIVAAGYQCILSNSDVWYLDHLQITWEQFYSNDPLLGITDPKQQALILGGETCMWSETVDDSDIFNTVWPRAAAAAERLWSPAAVQDADQFKPRLEAFRCLLTRRGVGAAAVNNKDARSAPPGPGSCFDQ